MISTPHALWVIGHRGAAGHALENSAAAFRQAANPQHAAYCDAVELDIHSTSDGHLVVHHDPAIASGESIGTATMSTLRANAFAAGSPVLTLEEALELLGPLDVWIEVKTLPARWDHRLLSVTERYGARCHVHAFDHRIVARLRQLDPGIKLGVLSCSYPVDPVADIVAAGATALWQVHTLVDRALVTDCHAAGLQVIAWTANDLPEIARLVELGVDGICTDWPDRVRGVVAGHGNKRALREEGR